MLTGGPQLQAETAPEVIPPHLPPKGIWGVYGTRDVYMKRHPGHGTSSLKELVGVGVLQTHFPSVGRRTRRGFPNSPRSVDGAIPDGASGPAFRTHSDFHRCLEGELCCYLP